MFSEIESKNKNRFSDPIICNLPICLKIFYINDCSLLTIIIITLIVTVTALYLLELCLWCTSMHLGNRIKSSTLKIVQ